MDLEEEQKYIRYLAESTIDERKESPHFKSLLKSESNLVEILKGPLTDDQRGTYEKRLEETKQQLYWYKLAAYDVSLADVRRRMYEQNRTEQKKPLETADELERRMPSGDPREQEINIRIKRQMIEQDEIISTRREWIRHLHIAPDDEVLRAMANYFITSKIPTRAVRIKQDIEDLIKIRGEKRHLIAEFWLRRANNDEEKSLNFRYKHEQRRRENRLDPYQPVNELEQDPSIAQMIEEEEAKNSKRYTRPSSLAKNCPPQRRASLRRRLMRLSKRKTLKPSELKQIRADIQCLTKRSGK
jgi:hypothetical protein